MSGATTSLLAQIAMRGKFIAALEASPGDGVRDLPHDLAVDGELVGGIDEDVHGGVI